MTMKSLAAIAVIAAASFGAASAHANLVTNGGFSSTYSVSTQFGTNATVANQQGVTGWTGNNGYDIWFPNSTAAVTENTIGQYSYTNVEKLYGPIANPPGTPANSSFIGLDGDQVNGIQGGISQTISGLVAGTQYSLSFDWGGAQVQSRTGATTDQLQASLGSQAFSTSVISNASQGFTGWLTQTFTFTATGSSELLNFLSIGTPGGLPPMAVLDNVSLTQVPEPVSLALLGTGLVGLGVVRRIRRKS